MELKDFFKEHNKIALAFSGGADSSFLLYSAISCDVQVTAYYVKTAFQPNFEFEDAKRIALELGASLKIIELDVLSSETVCKNPKNRCYFCKKLIFSAIYQNAKQDGFSVIIDGTNASDSADDRPGMKALEEMSVLSPLRLCGITKAQVRTLSKEAKLFTWNKPAYACLATRIPAGEAITAKKLERTEWAEDFLFSLGFKDFRVRTLGDNAKLELCAEQFSLALKYREKILQTLKQKYTCVFLDMEARNE